MKGGFDFISDESKNKSYFFLERIKFRNAWNSDLVAYYCDGFNNILIDVN